MHIDLKSHPSFPLSFRLGLHTDADFPALFVCTNVAVSIEAMSTLVAG